MNRQAYVAGVGELRTAAMEAGAQPHVAPPGPWPCPHRALNSERRPERCRRFREDRENVVAASRHLMATRLTDGRAHTSADIREHRRVLVTELPEQFGRALDIRQEERDLAPRQLPLRVQLRADEANRHDPVREAEACPHDRKGGAGGARV